MFAMELDLSVALGTAAAVAAACFFIRARHRQQAARVQAELRGAVQHLGLAIGPQIREVIAQRQLQDVEPVEPHVEHVEPLEAPLEVPAPEMPPEVFRPARPDWMRDSSDGLMAFVIAHRGIDHDWRNLHEAAKAGRIDVVSRLCNELQISALLVNKRGRNILHAAIDHRRYNFVRWLANWNHNAEELGMAKQPDYDQLVALFAAPDATGRKPFLSAAARRDTACVQAMAECDDGSRHSRSRLGPPLTSREEFIEVCGLMSQDMDTYRLLLSELRAFDVCWELSMRRDRIDEIRASVEAAPWWPPNLDEEPWSHEEARHLYWGLLEAVAAGHVSHVAWFLDQLHVSPSPPLGTRWKGQHLGDYALIRKKYGLSPESIGELEQTEVEKDAAAAEHDYRLSERKELRSSRDTVLARWDGLSSESLAGAVDTYLKDLHRALESSRYTRRHDKLATWTRHVTGRLPQSEASASGGPDSGSSVEMLQLLTDRLGVKGSPRLQMIALTGSAWALRWLIESQLVSLETPLGEGGEERLPSLEEGGEDNCCICLQGMLSPVRLIPCEHKVCRGCFSAWFQTQTGASRCPMCRAGVDNLEDVLPTNLVFALADDLERHAPWLSSSISRVPVGHVLAALAAYRGALTVLELLRDAGTDLTMTFDGLNLMHIACMNAQPHIVRWLIQGGHAQLALALSHERKRPLQYACESGDGYSLDFLRHLPANLAQREARAATDAQEHLRFSQMSLAWRIRQDSEELLAQETSLTTEQLSEIHHQMLADAQAEVEAAAQQVEVTRADLAAALAQAEPLAAAAEGWLEAALASPYERISNEAKHHQADLAAEEALTITLPRLLAQGAPLSAIIELAPHLKRSRIGDAADWKTPAREDNPWLQVVRGVSAHGRADVLRWFYSDDDSILSHVFDLKRAVDPDDVVFVDRDPVRTKQRETNESFGRHLATQHDEAARCALIQVYDDLNASKAAERAWLDAKDGLMEVLGLTKESYHNQQAPDFPEPAVADLLAAINRMDEAVAMFPDGMCPDYMRSGQELLAFDSADSTVSGSARSALLVCRYTCRNFMAVHGYLDITRWFVEVNGSTADQVMRMLYLSIRQMADESEKNNSADVQAYLFRWLLAQGAEIGSARFSRRDDVDDTRWDASREIAPRESSLLDVALDNAVIIAPFYSKEALSTCAERCWSCVELLQEQVPMTCFGRVLSDVSICGASGQTSEWWAERDDNIKRFLRFAEAQGIDLSGSTIAVRGNPASIAQVLTNGTWVGCVRWLAEERGVDLQHVRFDRSAGMAPRERAGSAKAELLRLQRAQRQRHAARGVSTSRAAGGEQGAEATA